MEQKEKLNIILAEGKWNIRQLFLILMVW
jgi:hypothetical protein